MSNAQTETIDVGGVATRLLRDGAGPIDIVFLHGGMPGLTPYCAGAHVWETGLEPFVRGGFAVMALDLPGAGGSALRDGVAPTIEGQGAAAMAVLERLGSGPCHVVGHAEGGLVALWLAMERPGFIRSVTVTASASAAPGGDLLENLTLAAPPLPLWSREAQAWALGRLSCSSAHIDDSFLDACVAASDGTPHRQALSLAADDGYRLAFAASAVRTKSRVFAMSRDAAFPTPIQLIWGAHDPLAGTEQGMALYRFLAGTQPDAVLNILGRTGHLPFREKPEEFCHLVRGFLAGLSQAGFSQPV